MNELTSIMDKNGKYLNMKHLNGTIMYACMNVCMYVHMYAHISWISFNQEEAILNVSTERNTHIHFQNALSL